MMTRISLKALLFAACFSAFLAEPESVSAEGFDQGPPEKVVFGGDDRIDVYEETDPARLSMAASTCALINGFSILDNGDNTKTLRPIGLLGERFRLCPDERFFDQPTLAGCTGFLVAPDIVVTAGHCFYPFDLNSMNFVFGYEMLDEQTPSLTLPEENFYIGVEILDRAFGSGPDYAVIRLDRPVTADGVEVLNIRRYGTIRDRTPVGVTGHPSGLPLKLAFGDQTRVWDHVNTTEARFVTNSDILGGNSGSPVFNVKTGIVEGIMVGGPSDYFFNGTCTETNQLVNTEAAASVYRSTEIAHLIPSQATSMGTIYLDDIVYEGNDVAEIVVSDADETSSVTVMVTTDNGDSETVVLDELMTSPSVFGGTIALSDSPGISFDNTLNVAHDVTISAIYTDENDGSGSSAEVMDTAIVDMSPPPSSLTEIFGHAHDLSFKTLVFTPTDSRDRYSICVREVTEFPSAPESGTMLELEDDDSVEVPLELGRRARFFGVEYSSVFVGSNGTLNFIVGSRARDSNPYTHFNLPQISAMLDDLNPEMGGTISWKQFENRFVVTYEDVPESGNITLNNFQVEIFFSGVITITHLSTQGTAFITGLSDGTGDPPGFESIDLTASPECVDPLAWYRFDGDLTDSGPFELDGSLGSGLINYEVNRYGQVSRALDSETQQTSIDFGTHSYFNDMANDFGLTCWINPTDFSVETLLLSHTKSTKNESDWSLGIASESDLNHPSRLFFEAGTERVFSSTPLEVNTWQHLALSRHQPSGTLLFWIDGEPAGTFSEIDNDLTGVAPLMMGSSTDSAFTGLIDDLRFYGQILDNDQVEVIYEDMLDGVPCTYVASPTTLPEFSFSGGMTNLDLNATEDCPWLIAGLPGWLVASVDDGVGTTSVTFTADANTGAFRSETFTVASEIITVTQEAAPCDYEALPASFLNIPSSGSTDSLAITTRSDCPWNITALPDWIMASQESGTGSSTIQLEISENLGGSRSAMFTAAGESISVSQDAAPCEYEALPASFLNIPSSGLTDSLAITTRADCPWNITALPDWIMASQESGMGSSTIQLEISENLGGSRSAMFTAAGESISVSQEAAPCGYTVFPAFFPAVPNTGSTETLTIATGDHCFWSISGLPDWIIPSIESGTGFETTELAIAINQGGSRFSDFSVAGKTITVSQVAAPCTYTVDPLAPSPIASIGGSQIFTVTTSDHCSWQVGSLPSWLSATITNATGSGTTEITAAENQGAERSAIVEIAGVTITIPQQAAPCEYDVSPIIVNDVVSMGSTTMLNITTRDDCPWTIADLPDWILASEESGTGSSAVQLTISENPGGARTAQFTVAGEVISVSQEEAPCEYELSSISLEFSSEGGSETITLTTLPHCPWEAQIPVDWITLNESTGTGSSTLSVSVERNIGPQRSTLLIFEDQSLEINQQSGVRDLWLID